MCVFLGGSRILTYISARFLCPVFPDEGRSHGRNVGLNCAETFVVCELLLFLYYQSLRDTSYNPFYLPAMALVTTTSKHIILKYPQEEISTVVIGDSQTKYVHQHFDPCSRGTPAFISQVGAHISDVRSLLHFVPESATALVLHIGTNDIASTSAAVAFGRYRSLLEHVMNAKPHISRIYATLVLPRCPNRRNGNGNLSFVYRCNMEATYFNRLLHNYCRRSKKVFFVDHGLHWLPLTRVLAADGLHLSFEGVAIIASHIRELCCKRFLGTTSSWRDCPPCEPPERSTPTSPRRRQQTSPAGATHNSGSSSQDTTRQNRTEAPATTGHRYPTRRNAGRGSATD